MAIRKIIRYPASSLKDPCTPVSFPLSAELLEHIGDLKDTLAATPHGAALASNQILPSGHRVFVTRAPLHRWNGPRGELMDVYINPGYQPLGTSFVREMESCLSIPELGLDLERYETVQFGYFGMDEQTYSHVCTGFAARVVQHEMEHLDGKLLTDRLNTKDRAKLRVQMFNSRKAGR